MTDKRIESRAYTREFGEDAPEITRLDVAVLTGDPGRQRRVKQPQAARA